MAQLEVDFIGHSALVIELDGIRLLTDPVTRARVGPLRRVEAVPDRHRLAGMDAVLISHLHWDHLDVPSLRDLGSRVPMIVPAGSGAWVRSIGFRHVRELTVGSSLDVGGVEIRAVEALHSGFRPPLGPTAPALGYVIRGSRSVYFAGDTDLFEGMADLGGPIDLALIPVWGWGPTLGRGLHLDPLRAAEALRLIRPRAAVPIHWGTYWPHAMGRVFPERLVEPPAAFAEYAAELAPDVRTLPTAVGDMVEWKQ
ncbi:MAG: MBL fold metallo-hydrolase [Chloroflexota bacterium]|jgi:L-ascorbate metabolism protein UlaG (beta-lactamase superfamily)|nr:MBL fold metallo-hydrolase [Chloroflexota bacterium]